MEMRTFTEKTVMHSYPGMVALVTVSHKGETNIMAAGWHSYISYAPPMYGVAIGRERHTYSLVKEAESFAINFLPFDKAEAIQQSGVSSGRDGNKLERTGLTYDLGRHVKAPILHDAYVAYECKTIDRQSYGDHDWFVAEMVGFYRDEELFLANGLPDPNKLHIPLYLGRSSYARFDDQTVQVQKGIEE